MDSLELEEADKEKNGKRKRDRHSKSNDHRSKRQAKAYAIGNGDKKNQNGDAPKCDRCHQHHTGWCSVKCQNCSKKGHTARDCRARPRAMVQAAPEMRNKADVTCYGCGKKGHYRNECRESRNRGN